MIFMKRKNFGLVIFLFIFAALVLISACETFGQRQNTLQRRCAGGAPVVPFAKVEVERDGDVNIIPCSGRSFFLNGSAFGTGVANLNGLTATTQTFAIGAADTAAFSSVTSTHTLNLPITAVSGATRTNFFPYFNAQNTLAKSPFSWDATLYTFNNTALNSNFKMTLTPSNTTGNFQVGDSTSANNYWLLSQSGNSSTFNTVNVSIGDTSAAGNGTRFTLTDGSGTFTFLNTANTGIFNLTGIANYQLNRTITAAATTGNQTINKPSGRINFAASTNSLVVTNSTVTATSTVIAVAQTNDATCSVKNVVAAAGSFTINMTANCTAETAVSFLVLN